MATLNGIVRFSGQLGDLIFYRSGKKNIVRRKSSTYQLSENSKKSAKDFGEASRNAAYIRKAFAQMVKDYGYGDLNSRLIKRITTIFKHIPTSNAGSKKLRDGNLKIIEGFEFNACTRLDQLLLKSPDIKPQTNGLIEFRLPKIDTRHLAKLIPLSDGFVLQVMVFNFDLNDGGYEIMKVNDLKIAFDKTEFPGAKLAIQTEQMGERALLIAIGIFYLHEQQRKDDRKYFACQISNCWHLRDGLIVDFVEPQIENVVKVEEEEQGLSWEMGVDEL